MWHTKNQALINIGSLTKAVNMEFTIKCFCFTMTWGTTYPKFAKHNRAHRLQYQNCMDPLGVPWAATRALIQNNLPSLAIGIIEILMNMILDKHQSAFGERTPKQQIRDSINIQQAVGAYFGIYSWYQINICFLTKSSPQSNFRHKCMQECRMWLDWNATHFFCLQVSYCWWRCCLLIEQIYISYWCPLLPPGTNHKM